MQKQIRTKIFYFVLGVTIAIGITSVFAYSIFAPDVGFTPTDSSWKKNDGNTMDNVSDALDDLYDKIVEDKNRLYLYWLGNEYESLTGGWGSDLVAPYWHSTVQASMNRKDAVKYDTYIDLTNTSSYQYVPINTKKKIDCTDYNYLNLYYTYSTYYRALYRVLKDLSSNNYATDTNSSNKIYSDNISVNPGGKMATVAYPISCSEPGYIVLNTARGDPSDASTNIKIYGIYLSK